MRDLSEKRWEIPRYKKGVGRMKTKKLILLAGGLAAFFLLFGVVLFPKNSFTICTPCQNIPVWTDVCSDGECIETNYYYGGIACCGHDGYYGISVCIWVIGQTGVEHWLLDGECVDPDQFACTTYDHDCTNPNWSATLYDGCSLVPDSSYDTTLSVYKCYS